MGDDERSSPPDEGWSELSTTVLSEDGADETETEAPDQAYLIVLAGSRVGEMIRVSGEMTVGRGDGADVRVEDDGVSRFHLRLSEMPDGGVLLKDMESLNGTFVNGHKTKESMLADGDKIQIGSMAILKFSYSDLLDEEFQQQMFQAAVQDPLTKLYNRRRLMEQLGQEFKFVQRHQTPLTVIMLDIDHFKQVNDLHGHSVGDAVLVGFADLLRGAIRGEDLAARYGGEEFIVLCRGIGDQIGAKIAERLRKLVAEVRLVSDRPDLEVTISAGVASIPDPRIGSPEELIGAADKALYAAKTSGRNQVCIFS